MIIFWFACLHVYYHVIVVYQMILLFFCFFCVIYFLFLLMFVHQKHRGKITNNMMSVLQESFRWYKTLNLCFHDSTTFIVLCYINKIHLCVHWSDYILFVYCNQTNTKTYHALTGSKNETYKTNSSQKSRKQSKELIYHQKSNMNFDCKTFPTSNMSTIIQGDIIRNCPYIFSATKQIKVKWSIMWMYMNWKPKGWWNCLIMMWSNATWISTCTIIFFEIKNSKYHFHCCDKWSEKHNNHSQPSWSNYISQLNET